MTRDDVIAMAKEAGFIYAEVIASNVEWRPYADRAYERLERFAALVAAAEREACAQVAQWTPDLLGTSQKIAAAIRDRGKEAQPATVADNERDHAEEDASIAAGWLQAGIAGRVA